MELFRELIVVTEILCLSRLFFSAIICFLTFRDINFHKIFEFFFFSIFFLFFFFSLSLFFFLKLLFSSKSDDSPILAFPSLKLVHIFFDLW